MVIEQRKDMKQGAEDLQTFAWMMYGVGGTISCVFAGWWTTIWGGPHGVGARLCYGLTAVFVAILGCAGPFINKELEANQTEMVQMSFWPRTKFVFSEIGEGLKIKELYTSIIYQCILICVVPSFQVFLYYYYILGPNTFTQFQYAMLQLIGNASMIPGCMLYNWYLKEAEFTHMMWLACFVNFFGAYTTMLYCMGIDLGYPYLFTMGTATVTDVMYMCFTNLPILVLFAKLIPERIESSLFAFSTGLMNLGGLFVSPDLGNLINRWFVGAKSGTNPVTGESTPGNLTQTVWVLYGIQTAMSIIPCFFVWLLPSRARVAKVQMVLDYLRLRDAKDPPTEQAKLDEAFDKLDPN